MSNHSPFSISSARRSLLLIISLLVALAQAGQVWADFNYVVQPGDSLSRIARNTNTTVAALIAANKGQFPCLATNAACLQVGWVLVIPGSGSSTSVAANPGTYVVQSGDSLAKIARKFGVSYSALVNANRAGRSCLAQAQPCPLQIGWTLIIPGGAAAPVQAQTPEATVREYFAALNAHDFARFKAVLHPDLLAQSPDPDFDIRNFIELVAGARIQFQILSLTSSQPTADTAFVTFTERVTSPLANINGYENSATFSLAKLNGRWLIVDEGVERVELVP